MGKLYTKKTNEVDTGTCMQNYIYKSNFCVRNVKDRNL